MVYLVHMVNVDMDNLTLTGGNVVVGRFDFAACNHLRINHQLSPTSGNLTTLFSWGSLVITN